jgi:CBS domain-containing protein
VLSGLWLVAVAFMVGQAARGAALHGAVSERLEAVRVADVMDADPVAIPATTASGDARDWYFARYGEDWFPVVDDGGHFLGVVRRAGLLGGRSVENSLERDGVVRVDPSEPITAALRAQAPDGLSATVAVDPDGVLRGVLTAERLRRAVTEALSQG